MPRTAVRGVERVERSVHSSTNCAVCGNRLRVDRIGSPRKVGILPATNVNEEPRFYLSSGDTFRVSKTWASPTDGRAVLKLTDGASWASEFSRRDAGRRVVAPVDGVGALALRDESAAKAEAESTKNLQGHKLSHMLKRWFKINSIPCIV